jgi:acetyltransferase-like isoleucine patch superfamily enzyme
MIRNFLRKVFLYIIDEPYRRNSMAFLTYLRKCGIKIGAGTRCFDSHNIIIDVTRPELIEIGSHMFLHAGTTIMSHDWASWNFIESHAEFYPSHGRVKIGDNVWLGRNVTICKGVTIGDNCIIGIGSVVTKSIPANSVAAGVPARVICTYEEYIEKRRTEYVNEAIEYASAIIKSGRVPRVEDFKDDYPCFVDGENYKDYDYPYSKVFNPRQFSIWKQNHKKIYKGFEEFIQVVKDQN